MTPEQASRMSIAEQHEWFRRATSRRSLLRGGAAIGAGAVLAGPALSGTADAATSAGKRATPAPITKGDWTEGSYLAPFGRHIAFGADPTTQVSVSWRVAGQVNNPFIRLGRSPFDLGHQISADVRNLATPASVWNTASNSPVDSVPPSLASSTIEQYYLHAPAAFGRTGAVMVRSHFDAWRSCASLRFADYVP
jgi:hypothetical protein